MHLRVCVTDDGRFDLIVIGGGPAGATASTLVSLQGHSVLLLERERFPRYQIGESLLPVTIHAICRMLGVLDEVERANFVRKFGGVFRWGTSDEPWNFKFGTSPELEKVGAGYAYQVERSRFDHILLDNARRRGVDVRERHVVTDVIVEGGRVSGVRYIDDHGRQAVARARFVVDASGNAGGLHRRVGDRIYSEFFRNVALFCYFDNAGRMPGDLSGNVLSVTFKDGWFWFIPLSDRLTSVGAVVSRDQAYLLQRGHERVMREFIDACPLIKRLLAPATRVIDGPYGVFRVRRDYSYVNSHFWRPGLALIGDAACFVDPVFSTGVHLATYAGLLVARSVNSVLAGDLAEEPCFAEFERRYRAEYENIYKFLIGFYDLHQDEQSYFWNARKVLNTTERANEAFVRLVSGMSTTDANIFEVGHRISGHLKSFERDGDMRVLKDIHQLSPSHSHEIQAQALLGERRPPDKPHVKGGLVASRDGFRWAIPETVTPS
jgi:FAD-dependent halogenase